MQTRSALAMVLSAFVLWGSIWMAHGASSVMKPVRIEVAGFVGDNMILQRPMHGDDHPVLIVWSDAKAVRARFQGRSFDARRSGERSSDRLEGWAVTLTDLDLRVCGDLVFEAIIDRKKQLTQDVRFTNVCVGDVWCWAKGLHAGVPRLTNALSVVQSQKLQTQVRFLTSAGSTLDPRSSSSRAQWLVPDVLKISPAAAHFALGWLDQRDVHHVGIIELSSPDAMVLLQQHSDWFSGAHQPTSSESSALKESNLTVEAFKSHSERMHRLNVNQYKFLGILVDDSPLPEVEINKSLTIADRSSPNGRPPFRGLISHGTNSSKASLVK